MLRFLFVLALLAVATYLVVRAFQARGLMPERPGGRPGTTGRARRPGRAAPPRIVAPDDDEDFLRDLDRRRLNPEDPEG